MIENAAVSISSLADDEVTKLRHTWLGHISENGMAEVSRMGLFDG